MNVLLTDLPSSLSSLTADEVDQGRLQDPGGKKGWSLHPEARGTGQDPTQKTAVTRAMRTRSCAAERNLGGHADDEVDRGQLQDPEGKKGRSLLPKARGTGQDPTRKGGWCALVPLV